MKHRGVQAINSSAITVLDVHVLNDAVIGNKPHVELETD